MATNNSNRSPNKLGSYLGPVIPGNTGDQASTIPPGALATALHIILTQWRNDYEDPPAPPAQPPLPKLVCNISGGTPKHREDDYTISILVPKGSRKPVKMCFYVQAPAGFGGGETHPVEIACIPPDPIADPPDPPYTIGVHIPGGNDVAYQDTQGMNYDVFGVATYNDGSTQESTHCQFTVAYP